MAADPLANFQQDLLAELSAMDAQFATVDEQFRQQIEARRQAAATAGSEYQGEADQAAADLEAQSASYQQVLDTTGQKIDDAAASFAAAEEPESADAELNAVVLPIGPFEIGGVDPIGPFEVASNSVEDIQAAVDAIAAAVNAALANLLTKTQAAVDDLTAAANEQLANLKAVGVKLNDELTNGAIGHLKEGSQSASEAMALTHQQFAAGLTPADVEAEIAARLQEIQSQG